MWKVTPSKRVLSWGMAEDHRHPAPIWDRRSDVTGESENDFLIFKTYLHSPIESVAAWVRRSAFTLQDSTLLGLAAKHRWRQRKRAYHLAIAAQEAQDLSEQLSDLSERRRHINGALMDLVWERLQTLSADELSPAEMSTLLKLANESSRLEEGEATHIIRSPDIDAAFAEIALDDALDIEV